MSETKLPTNVTGPSVLIPLSEYGEFFSLLGICAKLEPQLGLHPIFVFGPDYGLATDHGKLVQHRNWSWLKLGSKEMDLFFPSDSESGFGYFQSNPAKVINNKQESEILSKIIQDKNFEQTALDLNADKEPASKFLSKYIYLKDRIRKILKRRGLDKSPTEILPFYNRSNYRKLISHAESLHDIFDVRLVVSGQDFAGSATNIVSSVAVKRGISTAIIPYSMPPTTKELIESLSYLKINHLQGIEKWYMTRHYPNWVNIHRGEAYGRVSVPETIDLERQNLSPPLPWTPNSGHGIIFSPSQRGMDYYLQSGIPSEKLILTGAEWSDHLVANADSVLGRKTRLLNNAKAALSADKRRNSVAITRLKDVDKIVLISWPPNQYPRKAQGAETFQELCTQFVQALGSIQEGGLAHVVVSLHPTLIDSELVKSIRGAGLYLLPDRLIDNIDCADIFCATVSSTNFWSLQCGIPTINFDGFLYGYSEFDDAGGLTVETTSAMRQMVERLLTDHKYYQETSKKIIAVRDEWVMRDGKCSQRIIENLSNLVK